ncbi:hypothetical protein ACYSNM_12410 [Myroides sp. LJL116]
MKKIFNFLVLLPIFILVTSCSTNTQDSFLDDPFNKKTLISTLTQDGYTFNLYSQQSNLWAPYTNSISLQIYSSDQQTPILVKDLKWHLTMHMISGHSTMQTMTHSAPATDPRKDPKTTGLYHGELLFTMPGNEPGQNFWTLTLTFLDQNTTKSIDIPLFVDPLSSVKKKNLASFSYQNTTHYVGLIEPTQPKIGENNLQIAVFNSTDHGQNYKQVPGLTISLDPRMPDMGNHGVNNEIKNLYFNPVSKLYPGSIPFTMSGYWLINLIIQDSENQTIAGSPVKENINSTLYLEVEF